jgi:hypothetical protein
VQPTFPFLLVFEKNPGFHATVTAIFCA